jgi:hypothetical protein
VSKLGKDCLATYLFIEGDQFFAHEAAGGVLPGVAVDFLAVVFLVAGFFTKAAIGSAALP